MKFRCHTYYISVYTYEVTHILTYYIQFCKRFISNKKKFINYAYRYTYEDFAKC